MGRVMLQVGVSRSRLAVSRLLTGKTRSGNVIEHSIRDTHPPIVLRL